MATFYFCAVPPNTPLRPRGFERVATVGPYYVAEAAPRCRLLLRPNPGYPGPRPQRLEEMFNPRRPLFARAAMRRAANFAIDRRALSKHPIPEMLAGRPTDQLMPPGWPGFRDATIYPLGGPNLAAARRLAGGRPAAWRHLHVEPLDLHRARRDRALERRRDRDRS